MRLTVGDGTTGEIAIEDMHLDASMVPGGRTTLALLDGPRVSVGGERRPVSGAFGRVVAFLGLRAHHRVERARAAGALWPDASESRALSNLRTVLWRARSDLQGLIESDHHWIRLSPVVAVDIHDFDAAVVEAVARGQVPVVLPGWDEEWAVAERERLRQRALHLVERRAAALVDAGRYAEAIDHGLVAIAEEPLRESAYAPVVDAMLAAGNYFDAMKLAERYASLLRYELGMGPSDLLYGKLEAVARRRSVTTAVPSGAA